MVFAQVRCLASKALVVGSLGLSAMGSAEATLVVGEWDPQFDPVGFGDLGWSGKLELNVPSACLNQVGPPALYSTLVAPCSGTTILSATVVLYDIDFPLVPLETLDFTPAFLPNAVTTVGLQAPGNVIGVDTTSSSPILSTIALAKYLGVTQASFSLDFDVTLLGPSVQMNWTAGLFSGSNVIEPIITYSVPEPFGAVLSGTALLALALTRRRRPG